MKTGTKSGKGFAGEVSNNLPDAPSQKQTALNSARHEASLLGMEARARQRDRRAAWRTFRHEPGRVRDLGRFFAFAYGEALPDDDAGREDFFIFAHHVARLNGEPVRNIRRHATRWCPWMGEAELAALVRRVLAHPRKWRADTLGQRLRLLDSVRTELGITTIRPINVSGDQLERRRRGRWNAKRRKQSREAYLANSLAKAEPWAAEGICRRTWERRRAKAAASPRQQKTICMVTHTCDKARPRLSPSFRSGQDDDRGLRSVPSRALPW